MNLHELNNLIHSATKTELQTNFAAWKNALKTIVMTGNDFDKSYYSNHTGRELFRKLYNFGLSADIYDAYDSGFRPTTYTFS